MGWTSSADPLRTVELVFDSKEAAIKYCENYAHDYYVEGERIDNVGTKSYASNVSFHVVFLVVSLLTNRSTHSFCPSLKSSQRLILIKNIERSLYRHHTHGSTGDWVELHSPAPCMQLGNGQRNRLPCCGMIHGYSAMYDA